VKIAAIVLAAGASTRLGRAKQTLVLGGETLVERAVRVAREAGLAPVVVVVAEAAAWTQSLGSHSRGAQGCIVALNAEASEGMAASIRCGVQAAQPVEGAVVMTCDQPALLPGHLRALCAEPATVTGSGYAGRVGVPAYFPAASFRALRALRGDVGARELLRTARVVVDESLALDVDTEADVARAMAALAPPPSPNHVNDENK